MSRTGWAVGGAAAVLLAGAAVAAESSKQSGTGSAGGTTTSQREGTYKEGDLRTVTITVKEVDSKNHKVTFEATVKPEANVTSSGQPIKLDQLREGDTVRAAFDPKTGEVVRVDVTPGPEPKK
jgi:Cu/Ag efflux protein CusF